MMSHLRPSADELRQWIHIYNLEDYLFDTVTRRFQAEGRLRVHDFFAIIIWKSNRAKTRIKQGLQQIGRTPEQITHEMFLASSHEDRLESLLAVPGIGVPMASAILTVCYPDQFTILDWRAWEQLSAWQVDGLPDRCPADAAGYLQYCSTCRQLAHEFGLSLRDLDRALWGSSWEKGLLELVDDRNSWA